MMAHDQHGQTEDDLTPSDQLYDQWSYAGRETRLLDHCQFVDMYHELEAGELGFLLSCNRDFASFEGIAPNLEFNRTQTRMEGASHCDFRYRQPS